MKTEPETTIEINDVKAIENLVITLNPGGGVTKVCGDQGVGKTTALDCVRRLTGNEKVKLEPRDGKKRGTIDCGTARITISSRMTSTGEVDINSLEGRFDISTLIDPKIAQVDRADAARIKALVQLRNVKADAELFRPLFASQEEMDAIVSADTFKLTDLVEMAASVKKQLDTAAKSRESQCEIATGHHQASVDQSTNVDTNAPHDAEELQEGFNQAVRRRQEWEAAKRAADEAEAKANEAKSQLAAAQEADLDKAAAKAVNDVETMGIGLAETADKIKALDEQRAALQELRTKQMADLRIAEGVLRGVRTQQQTVKECQELMDNLVKQPDAAEGEAAAKAVQDATDAITLGVKVRIAIKAEEDAKQHAATAAEHRKAGERLRNAAKRVEEVLSDAVSCNDLRVVAGRLVIKTDRDDEEPFAELSEGERAMLAIDQAVDAIGEWDLIIISQTVWGELSPPTRDLIHNHARKRHVYILIAEATAGPLRVEQYEVSA